MQRRNLMVGAAILAVAGLIGPTGAEAQTPIRIGEINSYTVLTAFTGPYRKGVEMAVDEINAKGGLLGRKLEVIFRDDGFKPADAVRHANELLLNEKVDFFAGTFASSTGLAVADVAAQQKRLFVAAEPLTDAIVWDKGSRYVFRLRPSTYMQALMLAEEAAKLPAKRWATLAPNYEYGTSFVAQFKAHLSKKRPDIEWVGEQWPAQGRLEAGPTVDALAAMRPEAIFNATFGPDLVRFVREGNTRDLFKGRSVVSALTGEPEYLDPLKDETPDGWIVTGYPWEEDNTPAHKAFRDAYRAKFNDYPRLGSLVGYTTFQAIGQAITKAGSVDTDKLIAALRGLEWDSPVGKVLFRGDHQSTMGAWVGKIAQRNGVGKMVDWRFADGRGYLPPEADGKAMRPAGAND